ncbi:hypothetical protein Golob_008078 [Gossypium lobatum]|uniref:Uncharacterized protein n=1 Tax=Gossypium lobatum TaxID=34289 RepID=A0A7J8MEE4_9ROSI|nr:hypothetical protein [Gossypium lobatum]
MALKLTSTNSNQKKKKVKRSLIMTTKNNQKNTKSQKEKNSLIFPLVLKGLFCVNQVPSIILFKVLWQG